MRHWIKRQTIDGYLDMGQAQIPPLPVVIGLIDRVTGIPQYLSVVGTYPSLSVLVTTTQPRDLFTLYGARDGPVLNQSYRLFASSGVLGVDLLTTIQASGRVVARSGSVYGVEITAPGGVLTYTNIAF